MPQSSSHIARLIYSHLNGTISALETAELERWTKASPENERLLTELTNETDLLDAVLFHEKYEQHEMRSGLYENIRAQLAFPYPDTEQPVVKTPVRKILQRQWWIAASVILVVCAGMYFWLGNNNPADTAPVATHTKDIAPGKEGAILTLADGSQVVLDSLGNGVIAAQNGAQVVIKNGALVYEAKNDGKQDGSQVAYNIMSTPKGRQFSLLLPDGTRVWLNAASSIRFPTVFTGNTRQVEVSGEAYFEVAKNPDLPFLVNVNNRASIEVLGTHFNVNAYENEATINTTLLEGKVKINNALLKPGQQAQLANKTMAAGNTTPVKIVGEVDVEKVVAWKNGLFNFEGATLQEVMRQLTRWYDIEVVFEGEVPDIRFVGEMEKNMPLKDLLETLEKTGVHFRIEAGRKLVVLP
ncbi:MAG: FecR family protein [Chitinophagaceae bacterium]